MEKEYAYAGALYTYTIIYLVIVEVLGIQKTVSKLLGTDDYVFKVAYSQVIFLIPVAVYLYLVRRNLHAHGNLSAVKEICLRTGINKVSPKKLLLSFAGGLGILPFLYLVNDLSLLSVKDVTSEKAAEAAEKNPLIVMFLVVAVLAPLVEEISYRGVYFGVYGKYSKFFGAVLTAVMFGLMHANLNQFAYAVMAGFIMAMFAYAGGSIFCSLIIHCIVNGSSVISLYYPGFFVNKLLLVAELKLGTIMKKLLLPSVAGLFIAGVCFLLMRKGDEKQFTYNSDTNQKSGRKPDVVLIVGMVVMLVNMIANEFVK